MKVESILRRLRTDQNTTMKTVASAVGLSEPGYQQIEVGRKAASRKDAEAIAEFFHVPLESLFVPKYLSVRTVEGA